MIKSISSWSMIELGLNLVLLFNSCLAKFLIWYFSFLICKIGFNYSVHLRELSLGLDDLNQINNTAKCLAHTESSINVSW